MFDHFSDDEKVKSIIFSVKMGIPLNTKEVCFIMFIYNLMINPPEPPEPPDE